MKSRQVCTFLLPTAPHRGHRPGAHGAVALGATAVALPASKSLSISRRQQQRLLPLHPPLRPLSHQRKMTIQPTWRGDLAFLRCRSDIYLRYCQSREYQIQHSIHKFADCSTYKIGDTCTMFTVTSPGQAKLDTRVKLRMQRTATASVLHNSLN